MDDDIAFNDWPNVDLHNNGTNSWFPAYGFHPPAGIIERDDFLGNPDADYFLNGTSTPCLYLETIHEETSDDLRSDSEISREDSPLGWLATDSETDSVICMDANNDETDCESDREIACPVKRRRQDNFLTLPSVDIEDYQSISRSSSLIQFETLEKQCQEISNSSPSIYSQFSYDSLEATRKIHQDNNNNNNNHNNSTNFDSVICDNETTLLSSNLKTWHSFDNLLPKRRDKFSAENLSEDSGYGEQMNAYSKFQLKPSPKQKANFSAYDCEIFQQQINGNFSASRQNLSVFNDDDDDEYIDDDHDDFLPSRLLTTNHHTTSSKQKLILERSSTECASKYTTTSSTSASVPDLSLNSNNDNNNIEKTSGICTVVVYSSVPKDLNLIGKPLSDDWGQVITTNTIEKRSIATTNCDLADFADDMANYKREGSYSEAMRNRVDLSDDEHSLCYNNNNNNNSNNKRKVSYKPKTTIEAFDRKILQVISESIHSMNSSQILDIPTANSGSMKIPLSTNRSTVSTPNLAAIKYHNNEQDDEIMDILMDEEHRRRSEHDIRRKSYSTNSGVSDFDDRSNTTKEVHFSPVVSEVNWKDDSTTTTAERESSYSMSSTPESELIENFTRALLEDNTSTATSQQESPPTPPPLSPLWQSKKNPKTELNPLSNTARFRSRSQPDMSNNNNKLNRRRLSMFLKKETDGTIVKAYIDCDGVQYKHTHLDEDIHGRLLGAASKYHSADLSPPSPPPAAAAAAASSSSPKLNSHVFSSTTTITSGNVGSSSTDRGRHGIITTTTTTKSQPVGVGMDADVVVNVKKNDDNERKKHNNNNNNKTAKFGGFFSRLASFRFTNKKGASDKKGKNKNLTDYKNPADALLPQQRIATKDDYIYIPLKGPSSPDSPDNQRSQLNNDQNGQIVQQQQQNVAAARKPPLPRAPPRVVGASVKRNDSSGSNAHHRNSHHHHHHHHNHQNHPQSEKQHQQQQQLQQQQQNHHHQQHRRRRTIDSGESCPRPMEPMGLIETDLDTEVTVITSGANVKTRSLMNLGAEPRLGLLDTAPCNRQRRLNTNDGDEDEENSSGTCQRTPGRPHKSMEFLLDKQNLKVAEPPENELQKGERVMSEHQLRVQRSLQKLNVPDWYKQSQIPREGFLLKKSNRETRWTGTGGGTGSKTTSLNSLGSNLQSPIISSPTNCNQTQPFIRWSTSKLNSTASSPCASIRSSFNARQPNGSISPSSSLSVRSSFSYRQPYLGWRSQERLTRPRTPAERLANSLLNQQQQQQQKRQQQQQQQEQDSPEIQTSIKEVTSAIVHYVSGLKPPDSDDNRSESASPRGSQKLCWLESSFVGIRPLDSPETPVGLSENQTTTTQPQPPSSLRLDLQQTHNDMKRLNTGPATKLSPGSTTLEDVLDSLLGLPSSDRAPSPSLQVTASANTSPSRLAGAARQAEQFRRRSEGNEPTSITNNIPGSRRVSFQSSPILQCRYSRCGRSVPASSSEAVNFKNCHNCSYTYCSRACRRAHWEKHRKTCLFSRIGTLCRQVIASIKEQKDTLHHLSTVARRGYLSHGAGAVKCFFPCPEAAEKFLSDGLNCLDEVTYIRWPDLLPSEMGPQLYTELVQMCKSYNPDTKLVLYVSICVVSETPASGAVKWERQLVSRCAKMRLSKDLTIQSSDKEQDNIETLILTTTATTDVDNKTKELKQLAINNVQKQLRQCGVSLRHQYPVIYKQLCDYVDGNCEKFTPITVYPKDSNTGKSFMCIIMLDADPDSLKKVELAGVKVRTVDVLRDLIR